jgi:ribonuclease BN (tRNA processing enzyme)
MDLSGTIRGNGMRKYSLTCFGVGDGWSCTSRNHASFLYRFGKTAILLDCGEPVDSRFMASGLNRDIVDSIFISHLHADHVGGFFMLMQGCWLEGRRKDLPVYLPGGAIQPLREMLNAAFVFNELLGFRLQFMPLKPGKTFKVRDVQATAFPTTHLDGLRSRFHKKYHADFSAYCFLLESGGRRIGHSADLGRPEDLEPLLVKPLDLLVCELAHFTPEDVFCYLRGRKIKRIAFVHLARPCWENLAQTRRLAARMLPDIPHTFARDGAVIGF